MTPEGPKRSCTSRDSSVGMKTTREREYACRTPIFEKIQTANTTLVSKDSDTMQVPANKAKNDKENSCNSEVKPVVNGQSSPSVNEQKVPLHSTPASDAHSFNRALEKVESPSVEEDHACMEDDETFHSAHEESDALYKTCSESFTNVSSISTSSREFPVVNKETNQPGCLNTVSVGEGLCKGQNFTNMNLNEGEQDYLFDDFREGEVDEDVDQENKASRASLSMDVKSLEFEELTSNDVSEDQISCCDDLMDGGRENVCDDFKKVECVSKSDHASKSLHLSTNGDFSEESDFSNLEEAESNGSHDKLKEEGDEGCEQIDKPFNDIHLDRDSNDGAFAEASDSSDEDLLTPPRFLYEKMQLKPNVRTPEKGIAPAYSTPSPVTRDVEREEKTKYKLSFDKLIKEKAKRKEKDAELAEMEAELQRGLEKGGIGQMQVPSTFSDIESEEELTDDGRDLKDCALPKDIKKFLVDVHDFSEELPGEDIFPMFHPYVTSQDFPRLSMVPPPSSDNTFEAKLLTASDSDLQELLCGGWILQHYLDNPCPPEVTDWLFQIMCRHSNQHIISSSFQVLWVLVEASTENRNDLPQTPRGSTWVPSTKKVLKELFSLGATVPRFFPGDLLNQLNIDELFSSEISSGEMQMADVTASSSPQMECFPVVNIMHLVQFLTHCLQKHPRSYTVQDLRNLVVMLCQLALDVRLQTVVFDIEMCLAAVLNCFGEVQWPDEIKELCGIVAKLSTEHRNLLHLVQIQPPSVQGVQLQRRLSMALLHWLVPKFYRKEETGKSLADDRCDVTVPESVEVSSLVKLVEQIKPGEESDYFLLHTVISLVSLAVGSEDLPPKERGSLEMLTNKLRTINGDIKDPRAAFMNRTKVKDLLVRTILRLAYMTQCIKPSREHHITSYFECTSSDYEVELLKETEHGNGEELSGNEEEGNTTGQEMDCDTSR